ncbi:MAG: glucosidase [Cytophagales bacterium]|nr:glucosidase [Cytophagales bacterium]
MSNHEKERLISSKNTRDWKKWGPYLSERQWGTVREDYSAWGDAWGYVPFEHAKSRAYRWGEDGIAGICDVKQYLCFAPAFWNEKDPILKERLFGLTGPQGNHGEDVKEMYYYLDSSPTHSYMKMLYKYPQAEFPYQKIYEENSKRGKKDPEYEILDTGVFDQGKYFDIFLEYAKFDTEDICIKITAINRGKEVSTIDIIPQIWFRNFWTYLPDDPYKPKLTCGVNTIYVEHRDLGNYNLYFEGHPTPLFTNNDTNWHACYPQSHKAKKGYWKDGINDYIVHDNKKAVNPNDEGTKAALQYTCIVDPGESAVVKLRLSADFNKFPFRDFDEIFDMRKNECNIFYDEIQKNVDNDDFRNIQRQAFAGMLLTKQFYYYDVDLWLKGDPKTQPPKEREWGRNRQWRHLNNMEIISMPDKWEYPWYAAWDLAFHVISLALVDPDYAKRQLVLLLREWYMHPNGQIPAYEWNFGDVNPPVHAWACIRVFQIERDVYGEEDYNFLERVFHKLMLNFTWWINQKDSDGKNIFEGGFLGMDNIGVFDRSSPLPTGGTLEQADATSWIAMYALNMLKISFILAKHNTAYEDTASKFLEHFMYIAGAINNIKGNNVNLWNTEDDFFYDVINLHNGEYIPIKIRSMVGLIPLFAIETIEPEHLEKLPHFKRRLEWFLNYRPEYASLVSAWRDPSKGIRRRFSLLNGSRLKKILKRMLDENEFLSDYGIRSMSKYHESNPYIFKHENHEYKVYYTPGESDSSMFGGNSNWRGPIWFPVNYMIIESLNKFFTYYRDEYKIEYPAGSGEFMNINDITDRLRMRLINLFSKDKNGNRPIYGKHELLQNDPHFKDYILYYEYFHGDTGEGLGASHQTGWTGLVAELIYMHYNPTYQDKSVEIDMEK